MKASQKFTQKDICADQIKLSATKDIDSDLRTSLIDPEHGILKAGCMPQVQTANAAGSKQLLDAISKAILHKRLLNLRNRGTLISPSINQYNNEPNSFSVPSLINHQFANLRLYVVVGLQC